MITDTLKELTTHAESIKNTEPHPLPGMEVQDEWRQGDVRIIRLTDDFVDRHASLLKPVEPQAQLAPGTTKGSRHTLRTLDGVRMWVFNEATPLDSFVFQTPPGNAIDHPEHGAVVDLPGGCYAVPGQRAFAAELRRVAD